MQLDFEVDHTCGPQGLPQFVAAENFSDVSTNIASYPDKCFRVGVERLQVSDDDCFSEWAWRFDFPDEVVYDGIFDDCCTWCWSPQVQGTPASWVLRRTGPNATDCSGSEEPEVQGRWSGEIAIVCEPCEVQESCICASETELGIFITDTTGAISDGSCFDCSTSLNFLALTGSLINCLFDEAGISTCAGGLEITLRFTGNLTVTLEYRTSGNALIARYSKTFSAGTLCTQSHTLDKVFDAGTGICTWPATITVAP